MPDGAFDATERQFLDLLETGSGLRGDRCASLRPGGRAAGRAGGGSDRRGLPAGRDHVAGSARPSHRDRLESGGGADGGRALLGRPFRSAHLGERARPVHAALVPVRSRGLDRIRRDRARAPAVEVHRRLPAGASTPRTRWGSGWSPASRCPTPAPARWPRSSFARAGYRIAVRSDAVGWAVATRQIGVAQVVLVQGHPEYDPSSLLREYRRDAQALRPARARRAAGPAAALRGPRGLGRAGTPARGDHRGREGPRTRGGVSRSTRSAHGRPGRGTGWRNVSMPTGSTVFRRGATEPHARRDHRHPWWLSRPTAPGPWRCPSI